MKTGWLSALWVFGLTLALAMSATATPQYTVDAYLRAHQQAGDQANRLIEQSSPYLLQHAYNPVQWYPWGEEAFEAAREQDKPIFLSIGYSTCYWCHVMARESFENPQIAAYLNRHFISIKVDREERPDIDNVYMLATELINGHGGWPMTVFLDHDLRPFHAGTYYPPEDRDTHTGLQTLLRKIVALWREDRERIDQAASSITLQIQVMADEVFSTQALDDELTARALREIADSFDEEDGGFGAAPKFPKPGMHRFLLRLAASDDSAMQMMQQTLTAMADGGIYDRIGGGFHRYAVDAQWRLPHFEKMLYTQALMVMAYADLYALRKQQETLDVITQTLAFVEREMQNEQGVFYSALDAESFAADGKKHEGAYYLWREAELRELLSPAQWQLLREVYAIESEGNLHHASAEALQGMNVLAVSEDAPVLSRAQKKQLQDAERKLFEARQQRPRPHLDDKIITAWNAMMIRAFIDAAGVTGEERYLRTAERAMRVLLAQMVDPVAQRLHRRMRGDDVGIAATLDDYVWTVNALLALHRQSGDKHWLRQAQNISRWQIAHFADEDHGGFFEAPDDRHLLLRSRSIYDGALPAANAVALDNLQQLHALTGNEDWQQQVQRAIEAFAASANASPMSAAWFVSLLPAKQAD